MNCQEKLAILVDSFRKLDEGRKDYFRELIRKLAEIHCAAGFRGEFEGNSHIRSEN